MKLVAPRVSWGQLEQRLEWDLLFQRQQSTLELEREHRLPFRSGLSAEIRDALEYFYKAFTNTFKYNL